MFGRKYYLNPETLRFEEVKIRGRKRLINGLVIASAILVLAFVMHLGFDYYAKSPRLVYYENKNEQLRSNYLTLSSELVYDEAELANLKRRDDRLYRSIFELEPLPSSIREAGTGGAVRHPSLNTISDPAVVIDVSDRLEKILTKAQIQSSSFDDLEEVATINQELLACKPSIQPLSPEDPHWLTSSYGYRADPFTKRRRVHNGIDLAGPYGLKIYATGNGKVKLAEHNRHGYGKEVLIDHGFGYMSRYAHLQEILVKSGEYVKRGQVIGTLGSTGRSTGPHLHYEIRLNNKTVNPMYFYYEDLTPEEFNIITARANQK